MVSVLASSEVDRGFELRSDQTKDYKLVHASVASQLSTHRSRERPKTDLVGIRQM